MSSDNIYLTKTEYTPDYSELNMNNFYFDNNNYISYKIGNEYNIYDKRENNALDIQIDALMSMFNEFIKKGIINEKTPSKIQFTKPTA